MTEYKKSNSTISYHLLVLMMAFFVSMVMVSCGDDPISIDPDPDPDPDPVVVSASFTVDKEEAMIGETVEIDGTGSTVQGADALTYSWTLNTPDGSSATLESTTDATTAFEVDATGDYQIILEVSAAGESDSASSTVVGMAPIEEISGTISEDMTLFSDILYRVVGDLTLSGATLTIEPGTTLEFTANTDFAISNDGRLVAEGTEQDSIYFTGEVTESGYWDGIIFQDATHPDNVMDYVVVEYAGGSSLHSSVEPANVVVGRSLRNANIEISNSVMRHSSGVGLYLHSNGALRNSGNNTFTSNSTGPVTTHANVMHYLDNGSTYTGNDTDIVKVYSTAVRDDAIWQAIDVPYLMDGNHNVQDAEITINAGAHFLFEADASIEFGSGTIIQALGTDGNEIIFTGSSEVPGWWRGLFVSDTRHPDNLLDHVIIEYGGGEAFHGSLEPANLAIGRSLREASISVQNSVFRHSDGYGMFVHNNGSFPNSSSNTYTENADGPAKVHARNARFFNANSDFTGNAEGENFVWLIGETVDDDSEWDAINVPYGVIGKITFSNAKLTVEPGATIAFDTESGLQMSGGSIIEALGTADDQIVFTGTRDTVGWWDGIFVEDTTHPDNAFDFVTVEYGGGREFHGSLEPTNLAVGRSLRSASINVTNSIFRDSADYGVYVHSNGSTNAEICTENTFTDNSGPDCTIE